MAVLFTMRNGSAGGKPLRPCKAEEFLRRDFAPVRRATNAESPGEPSSGSPGDSHGKWAATCSPACQGSTIGAGGLNFSVRDGKRWDTAAVAARMSLSFRHTDRNGTQMKEKHMAKFRAISSARL